MLFNIIDLGLVDFSLAWEMQKSLLKEAKSYAFKPAVILCQHYPVITLGRSAQKGNLKVSQEELKQKGVGVYAIERGGDVTYHGPGQLVIYPVLNLNYFKRDIHWFLSRLEEIAIATLKKFAITGTRNPGFTGVWVGTSKIASIGIAIRNWITFHGLAINVKENDLVNFDWIHPCGMDINMTSMETVLGKTVSVKNVKVNLKEELCDDQSYFA